MLHNGPGVLQFAGWSYKNVLTVNNDYLCRILAQYIGSLVHKKNASIHPVAGAKTTQENTSAGNKICS